jgi:hypothetical protein
MADRVKPSRKSPTPLCKGGQGGFLESLFTRKVALFKELNCYLLSIFNTMCINIADGKRAIDLP